MKKNRYKDADQKVRTFGYINTAEDYWIVLAVIDFEQNLRKLFEYMFSQTELKKARSIVNRIILLTSMLSVEFQGTAFAAPDVQTMAGKDPPFFQYGFDANLPGLRAPLTAGSTPVNLPAPELTEIWQPVRSVAPGVTNGAPPSDAVVLFDGSDLSKWEALTGGPAKWRVENHELSVIPYSGYIQTKDSYGDCQLHIEWKPDASAGPDKMGQDRSNSGIYFQGRYEVQILDSYNNPTYANGQAGAIYKQFPPLVNASKPPDQWQSYDIVFMAPRFDSHGKRLAPARLIVFQNGILVQNDVSLSGMTVFRGNPYDTAHGPAPLVLQDHHSTVRFRNIWLRQL